MRTFGLPNSDRLRSIKNGLVPSEHCLFTDRIQSNYELPEHDASLGIVYTLSGSFNLHLNGKKSILHTEDFVMVDEHSLLSLTVKGSETQPVLLYFQEGTANQIATSLYFNADQLIAQPLISNSLDFSLLERQHKMDSDFSTRLRLLADLPDSCSSFFALKSDAIVRSILEDILMANKSAREEALRLNVKKKSTRVEIYKRLYIAKEWMEANYHQPITLNDIADEALLNSQHFLRLFSQLFKKTPHQFLIDLRLERAGNLLATTNASVSDICLSVGWESLASFSKLFKQKQGLTPTAFRNMAQN